jgi:hypothetical protein
MPLIFYHQLPSNFTSIIINGKRAILLRESLLCLHRRWIKNYAVLTMTPQRSQSGAPCRMTASLAIKTLPIPWPKGIWRPCVGRWLPQVRDERCRGLNLTQKIAGVGGCKYRGPLVEDQSERPWLRWRIATFDEGPAPTVDIKGNSSTYFRSMTVEIVNGQRSVHRLC